MTRLKRNFQHTATSEKKNLPVFQLANLVSSEIKVTDKNLLAFYEKHGKIFEKLF